MGEVTPEQLRAAEQARAEAAAAKAAVLKLLRTENPSASAADLNVYADAFLEHRAAQANIAQHGTIVFHPRTGAPIENPYLKVRDRAVALMRKFRLRTDRLWTTLAAPADAPAAK